MTSEIDEEDLPGRESFDYPASKGLHVATRAENAMDEHGGGGLSLGGGFLAGVSHEASLNELVGDMGLGLLWDVDCGGVGGGRKQGRRGAVRWGGGGSLFYLRDVTCECFSLGTGLQWH